MIMKSYLKRRWIFIKINKEEHVTWNGQFRAPLAHASVIPRAKNNNLPIWRAVGGPPASAIKAGRRCTNDDNNTRWSSN